MSPVDPPASAFALSRRDCLRLAGGAVGSFAMLSANQARAAPGPRARQPKGAIPFHLGLASYTCRNFNLDRTLAIARRVGLDRICLKSMHLPLDAKPEAIAETVQKVKAAGLVLYGGGVISMRTPKEITHALEYAKAAGMTLITAAPTPEMLPAIDDAIKAYDIQVAIHNHGPGDRFFPTPESVYVNVAKLDKRIGLCIDIGHTVRVGADLLESVHNYADRLFDLHIKDVTAATPQGEGTPLGRGVIDIPGLVRALRDVKFKGVAAFEYEEQPDDPLPGLAESVGYMRGSIAASS
jgi:inosose dehydratase